MCIRDRSTAARSSGALVVPTGSCCCTARSTSPFRTGTESRGRSRSKSRGWLITGRWRCSARRRKPLPTWVATSSSRTAVSSRRSCCRARSRRHSPTRSRGWRAPPGWRSRDRPVGSRRSAWVRVRAGRLLGCPPAPRRGRRVPTDRLRPHPLLRPNRPRPSNRRGRRRPRPPGQSCSSRPRPRPSPRVPRCRCGRRVWPRSFPPPRSSRRRWARASPAVPGRWRARQAMSCLRSRRPNRPCRRPRPRPRP